MRGDIESLGQIQDAGTLDIGKNDYRFTSELTGLKYLRQGAKVGSFPRSQNTETDQRLIPGKKNPRLLWAGGFHPFRGKLQKVTLVSGNLNGVDIHTTTGAVEANLAVDERKDGVVATEADVATGKELCATLADDDVTGDDSLVTEFLHAEALADAVASVLDASLSFFMCHGSG